MGNTSLELRNDVSPLAEAAAESGAATRDASEHVLLVEDLVVRYGTAEPVVRDVSLTIARGETVAVVGESGSGKSTLVSAILGMLPEGGSMVSGRVVLNGRQISGLDEKQLRGIRGRDIGLVPQDPISNFNPVTRVIAQSIDADRAHAAHSRREARERVLETYREAELGGIPGLAKRYPHELSGGMRQRALIATSLLHHPSLVLADEPTSALDAITQKRILDRFAVLARENHSAVLFITHDLELALERADRIVVMRHGSVVEHGPSARLRTAPEQDYTKALLAASERFTGFTVREQAPAEPPAVVMAGVAVRKSFERGRRAKAQGVYAVDGVDFSLRAGQTLAVVGASGSGKTTLASIALGFLKPDAGDVTWRGRSVQSLDPAQTKAFRRSVQPVFQDPHTSLDPSFTVERTLDEALRKAGVRDGAGRARRTGELLDRVALPRRIAERYPHELSGGQKQRVAIARALALSPEILICDEPVSALDVIVQAQVIDLLRELQRSMGLSILLISHDLGVVSSISDDVIVMQAGRVVDSGRTDAVFANPTSDYTRELISSIPGHREPSTNPSVRTTSPVPPSHSV